MAALDLIFIGKNNIVCASLINTTMCMNLIGNLTYNYAFEFNWEPNIQQLKN